MAVSMLGPGPETRHPNHHVADSFICGLVPQFMPQGILPPPAAQMPASLLKQAPSLEDAVCAAKVEKTRSTDLPPHWTQSASVSLLPRTRFSKREPQSKQ